MRSVLVHVLGGLLIDASAEYCSNSTAASPLRDAAAATQIAHDLLHTSQWWHDYMRNFSTKPDYERKFVLESWEKHSWRAMELLFASLKRRRRHPERRLRVLDLGSGPGWFVWVLRTAGHYADGLQPMGSLNQAPPQLSTLLSVDPVDESIDEFTPLPPPPCRYDLVTAWLVCFDRSCEDANHRWEGRMGQPKHEWHAEQWHYFLTDLACNVLKPHGAVAINQQAWAHRSRAGLLQAARRNRSLFVVEDQIPGAWTTKTLGKSSTLIRVRLVQTPEPEQCASLLGAIASHRPTHAAYTGRRRSSSSVRLEFG
jgi:hypothetical protein